MIKRDYYLDRLIHNMWNGEIKVITGIRRCGKSVLLFDLFYEYLLSQGVKEEQIIRLELDQRRNYKYRNPITLCDYVDSIVSTRKDEKFYLFIDEVQFTIKVKDEENAGIVVTIYDMLNELKAYKNLDVYVTGSNSKMLSKDIATEFRGRATQIHVYPLSFDEFYAYVGGEKKTALDQYMLYGGMPRILALEDEKDKKAYLSNLYEELYVKDIVERNKLERKNDERIQREIDFVVNDGDRRIYIQSAYQMDTEQKTETELQSLKLTGDFFKKIVIRMDIPHNFYDNNGFYHCNLIDFLLGTTTLF